MNHPIRCMTVLSRCLILLFPVMIAVACQRGDAGSAEGWRQPVRFFLDLPERSIPLLEEPGADAAVRATVMPEDEENETFTAEVLAVNDQFVRVNIQGDTGWIVQNDLWALSPSRLSFMSKNGDARPLAALPADPNGLVSEIRDSLVQIDDGLYIIAVDLRTGLFIDYQGPSRQSSIADVFESHDISPQVYYVADDTAWAIDLYSGSLVSIRLHEPEVVFTVGLNGIPADAVITEMVRIESRIYFWGLQYEFEGCPLMSIDIDPGSESLQAETIVPEHGLLVSLSETEFLFCGSSGADYRYDLQEMKLFPAGEYSISAKPYRQILYVPSYDKFVGIPVVVY